MKWSMMLKDHINVKFEKNAILTQHIKLHTIDKNITKMIRNRDKQVFQCKECSKIFYYKSNLIVHERVHSGEKPYNCDDCDTRFKRNSSLTKHKKGSCKKT